VPTRTNYGFGNDLLGVGRSECGRSPSHWWGRWKLRWAKRVLWCGASQFYLPSRVLVRFPCIWRRTYVLHESLLRNACVYDQAPKCFFSAQEEVVCPACSNTRLLSVRILSLWAWRFELNQCKIMLGLGSWSGSPGALVRDELGRSQTVRICEHPAIQQALSARAVGRQSESHLIWYSETLLVSMHEGDENP
jgi:hypothetical protein